ncbi:hypothetical protein Rleg4DRAFT_1873 [Rhizobium leguminosarum bv. trifolii WSM2297]|uniref:Phage integrase family protein n=1 Tax=Rhizobium leguminosarum bv. trifolii WSM2297 TaxID=754762 RepID=J0CAX8_RHILT|nr:hypothetical protein [Rhizobium leguminosarum]EJC80252.1 hypothetical protein Rleg4DRAFT_1873 [Rhizobium leguminosarum bv. trifolii WSM2297]
MPVRLNTTVKDKSAAIDPDSRRRVWLGSGYEQHEWILRDADGKEITVYFDVKMADGRSLIEHPLLYATAKELLFWIRAAGYASIGTAVTHYGYAKTLLHICYGLTARGFYSFSACTALDIEMICAEGAMGVDGILRASTIIKTKLAEYDTWQDVPLDYLRPRKKDFILDRLIEACNLPLNWARRELHSELKAATARLNGKTIVSVAAAKEKPVVWTQINLITSLFDALYALRAFIKAPSIRFRPFPEGPSKKAIELGITSDRTPIPPPALVMTLLEQAVRFVAQNCQRIRDLYHANLAARKAGAWHRKDAEALRRQIAKLSQACFILISAFTARRMDEIKMLERDSLAGNDADGWWMRCYINKNERLRTWIPIPNIVARAVDALCSFDAAELDPESLLFEYVDPVSGKTATLVPEQHLNEFARSVGAVEYEVDDDSGQKLSWHWQTRQFRRFFAVLYIWRYKGKFESLSHHLRHFSLETTNDYVMLDHDNARTWTKEIWNFRIEVVRDLVTGRTTYAGPMGDRLNKLAKRLRTKFSEVQIVPEVLAKTVIRQLDKMSVVLTPKAWVTCCCPRTENGCGKAACRKLAGFEPRSVGPDYASAGPTVCPGCPWALIGPENLSFVDEEIHYGTMAANDDAPTIFGELQAANVVALRSFRDGTAA